MSKLKWSAKHSQHSQPIKPLVSPFPEQIPACGNGGRDLMQASATGSMLAKKATHLLAPQHIRMLDQLSYVFVSSDFPYVRSSCVMLKIKRRP